MWVPCVVITANVARRYTSSYLSCATAARSAPVRTRVRIEDARLAVTRLALLWQILSGMGFPNQFFCDFAAVPVSGAFLTSYRWPPKTCWPMPDGRTSVEHRNEKESSRLVLLLSACGSSTDHRSGSGTRVSNICQGNEAWLIVNTGCRERRNIRQPAGEDHLRTLAATIKTR
jgi:hypothetical protein